MKVKIDVDLSKKISLEKIEKNFDAENLRKIAELSEKPNANERILKLFNNPLFKAAL